MSLINQMLQELDARRADGAGTTGYGQQVRAVAEKRGVHPAWWVALALGIALLCVAGWALYRHLYAPPQVARPELPLKLETRLGTEKQAAAGAGAASAAPVTNIGPTPAAVDGVGVAALPAPVTDAPAGKSPSQPVTPPVTAAPPVQPQPQTPPQPEKDPARNKPASERRPSPREEAAKEAAMPPAQTPSSRSRPAPSPKSETQGEAAPAFAGAKQSKELSPQQRAENEYRKALTAVEQGKIADGINGLETTLQLDARHAAARQSLIGLLINARRQDEAAERAREGLALDEAQPGLAMILARLRLEKGALRAAIETLERTLPHARDRADYLAFLAALLQRDERHQQAAEYYIQALQRSPQNGVWWMGLGISLQADQRTAEASEAFRRAKSTNSLSPELTAFVNGRLSQLQR
ncbi:tetratricopeptide repeat protein [Noviherbaspirillum aerium]|uniref:tetratricopeptide repeat protein n=1 Tax=Noviherbaspirillum aerium TaxID=2588497 RepID=UPI00124CBA8D|nr:tetratricopeptide repeat protein [Noviherbaspirillum aerium]